MNSDLPSKDLAQVLRGLQRRWQRGLRLRLVMQLLALAGLLVLAAGLLDYQLGLDPAWRKGLRWGAGLLMVWLVARRVRQWRQFGPVQAARLADGAAARGDRPVQTALELSAESAEANASPLTRYLSRRAVEEACRTAQSVPAERTRPGPAIRRSAWQALGVGAVLAGVVTAFSPQARVVGMRLLDPDQDVPPWSPLTFSLTPAQPEVIYGGDLDFEAEVKGGNLPGPVRLLTRSTDGVVRELPAFQAQAGKFGRKLEKVTGPVEVAFASGKSRSAWLPVKLILQPRLEGVTVKLEPPAYSGLPPREFAAGTEEISGLAGTQVTLWAASNRPLSAAEVLVTPAAGSGKQGSLVIQGEPDGPRRQTLTWTLRQTAAVALTVKDVQGTPSAVPLVLEQKLVPDRAPVVELNSPVGEVLATADTKVPLQGRVEDDLGLNRVEWMRTLTGFRDRAQLLAQAPPDKIMEFSQELDLAPLGVAAGQVLEVTLQGQDRNPSLMGVGTSAVGRIRIITVEEYTTLIRAKTTMEEFSGRYQVLQVALKQARESLEALNNAPAAEQEAARQAAKDAQQRSAEMFRKIEQDFKAFDTDGELSKLAGEMAEALEKNAEELSGSEAAAAAQGAQAMLDRLGAANEKLEEQSKKAEELAAVGRLLEAAAMICVVHDEQRAIAEELAELSSQLAQGNLKNISKLEELIQWQEANARRMESFDRALDAAIGALPAQFAKMGQDALGFLEESRRLKILPNMQAAIKAGREDQAANAAVEAVQAFRGLETLLQGNSQMAATCRSSEPQFEIPDNMQNTLRQMMEGMCKRQGVGRSNRPGRGSGQGSGSGGDDGYAVAGKAPLDSAVFGPARLQMNQLRAGLAGGGGKGDGRGKGSGGEGRAAEASMVEADAVRREARRQIPPEAVPVRYREAVRRFYAEPESAPASPDNSPDNAPQSNPDKP